MCMRGSISHGKCKLLLHSRRADRAFFLQENSISPKCVRSKTCMIAAHQSWGTERPQKFAMRNFQLVHIPPAALIAFVYLYINIRGNIIFPLFIYLPEMSGLQ